MRNGGCIRSVWTLAVTLMVFVLQPLLVQAIFSRNTEEVQLLLHKKEDANALVGWEHAGFCKVTVKRESPH